jgi:hypothetical protein
VAAGVRKDQVNSAKVVLKDGTLEEIEAVKTNKAKLRKTADAIRARRGSSTTKFFRTPSDPHEAVWLELLKKCDDGVWRTVHQMAQRVAYAVSAVAAAIDGHRDIVKQMGDQFRFVRDSDGDDAEIAVLREKDAEIAALKAELEEKDAEIATLKAKLVEEAIEITTLRNELRKKNSLGTGNRPKAVFTMPEINMLRKALHPDGKPKELQPIFEEATKLLNDRAERLVYAAKREDAAAETEARFDHNAPALDFRHSAS